jgi:putative transposase
MGTKSLGEDLEQCSQKYRKFCYQYQPPEKSQKKFYWGSNLLPKLTRRKKATKTNKKKTQETKES